MNGLEVVIHLPRDTGASYSTCWLLSEMAASKLNEMVQMQSIGHKSECGFKRIIYYTLDFCQGPQDGSGTSAL